MLLQNVLTKTSGKGASFALQFRGTVHHGKKVMVAHMASTVQEEVENPHIQFAFSFFIQPPNQSVVGLSLLVDLS